ncbi:MAG: hypothetical protein IPG76_06075 [Acidobacteria bacterium]|nr:hypothetical protein [Acidobacteriota bacterium]
MAVKAVFGVSSEVSHGVPPSGGTFINNVPPEGGTPCITPCITSDWKDRPP